MVILGVSVWLSSHLLLPRPLCLTLKAIVAHQFNVVRGGPAAVLWLTSVILGGSNSLV